jgi:hypothetical protein
MSDDRLIERFAEAQSSLVLQASDLSLRTISDMVTHGAIDIAPKYQRRARWTPDKQSSLIESFLINVPVPPIYLSEDEYGTYGVIDGKQRITSIHLFLTDQLALRELVELPELNGRRYSQLPSELARTIDVRPFVRAITLLKQSDPELKYEVFTRLNRGGERLNAQEVRNVAYRGPLNDLIYKLSENHFLHKQLKITGPKSSAYRDMTDAEYVLRFMTLRVHWRTFSGNLSRSLDEYMRENRKASSDKLRTLEISFTRSIEACAAIWGNHAFRRPVDGQVWRDQTLAGMYDAQMTAISRLDERGRAKAIKHRSVILDGTRDLFEDANFENAVRVATNTPSSVRLRIERMFSLLQNVG